MGDDFERIDALMQDGDLDDFLRGWMTRPAWMADALCREYPEVDFFPGQGGDVGPAKAVCARCLVREECAAFAVDELDDAQSGYGVYGGTTGRQRVQLRRQRDAAGPPVIVLNGVRYDRAETAGKVAAWTADGWSTRRIADEIGATTMTVRRLLAEAAGSAAA